MSSDALTRCSIRYATAADAPSLARFAAQAFVDQFGPDNTASDMEQYLASAFGESIQQRELEDSRNTYLIAERDGETVGYALLREGKAPAGVTWARALEINRLYSAQRLIGSGIGAALMQRSIDEAVHRGCDGIWLAVWERNARAIHFYERWKFVDVGTQPFTLGSDVQADRIMTRTLKD